MVNKKDTPVSQTAPQPDTPADPMPTAEDPGAPDDIVHVDPARNLARRESVVKKSDPDTLSKEEALGIQEEIEKLRVALRELESRVGTAPVRRTFMMSEGVRNDVEMHGKAVDPATGHTFTREDLDKIGTEE